MRLPVALLAVAAIASCTPGADWAPSPEPAGELRWISVDVDALGALDALVPVEIAGDVAIVQLADDELPRLSQAMHEHHGRCGGFVLHDTFDDARGALAVRATARVGELAVAYTVDNAATVNALLPALSEANLLMVIQQLSTSFASRYYTSAGGLAVPMWLRDLWAGYAGARSDVTVELFVHAGFEQRSVIATITGTTKPDEVIVIGGHIDSIASGSSTAPGADDDASGIATLSEVLRALMAKNFRPQRTVKLIAYAAEEVGLRGSKGIVADFQAKGINVVGVMQLDMTNYKGSPQDIYLMQDYTNAAQNTFVGTLIDTYVGATWGTSQCGYGCSDHASWHNAGFPASMPAEARFADTNPNIHTTKDTLDVSGNSAAHALKFARLATAYVAELAKGDTAVPNMPPTVSITAPATASHATPIMLMAAASDAEDGDLSAAVEWSSSLDGALGTGASRSVSLSPGVHTITATVQDSAGASAQATTSITVSEGNADNDDEDGGLGGCAAAGTSAGGGACLGAAWAGLLACLVRRRRRRSERRRAS